MPYLTAPPTMAPLTLRPANAPEAAKHPADSHNNPHADDITPTSPNEDVAMEDTIDYSLLRDQMRQQQDERAQRLQAKNRRKRYLEVHPEYFTDSSLELADPLLYDRLIRRFQTASEREAEGRKKGFSGQMATDLWRAEAKKDALSQPDPNSLFTYTRGPQGEIIEEDKDDIPMSKEEGKAWWIDEMTQRFLRGGDDDFDYAKLVDGNPKYDDPEQERDLQDAYFESMESDFDSDGEGKEKVLTGETGIQDY
ncbi:coiled-coil domain-containing protein-domain-containing protein [Bipolaris maydis]|nr:coiled-coil domain-containing protein-domain-containing protein [Bipolaris maydis]KAJ6196197.1 coiled-coil domain-containing protein-domain-containing protein [Bipolaris maydis]